MEEYVHETRFKGHNSRTEKTVKSEYEFGLPLMVSATVFKLNVLFISGNQMQDIRTWPKPNAQMSSGGGIEKNTNLHSRCVNIKLLKDGESFLIQFIIDSYVSYIWSVVVVQSVNVFHYTGTVSFNGCEDQQVL